MAITGGPDCIRYDPSNSSVQPDVEIITRVVPPNIVRPIMKQAEYRHRCMEGDCHPMDIELHHYILVTLCTQSIDKAGHAQDLSQTDYRCSPVKFNSNEVEFIKSIRKRPEIEWAIDNSFDGLYIHRAEDVSAFATVFKFAAYMKEEQATFWKLKFNGT